MHESPAALPIACPSVFNPTWTRAVERSAPRLSISGHDHETPLRNGSWRAQIGSTTCVNVRQAERDFHHAIADFEFAEGAPALPKRIVLWAFLGDRRSS